MRNIIIIFSLFMGLGLNLHSQTLPDIPTAMEKYYKGEEVTLPTAAQFLRYDNLPIDEYTGIPNISIPIYEISLGKYKLPLTLTYHAAGIKVNQDASWVGLGWDLSVASIIQIGTNQTNKPEDIKLPDWVSTSKSTLEGYELLGYPTSFIKIQQEALPRRLIPGYGKTPISPSNPKLDFSYFITLDGNISMDGIVQNKPGLFFSNTGIEPDMYKISLFGKTINIMTLSSEDYKDGYIIYHSINMKGYKIIRRENIWEITDPDGYYFLFKDYTNTQTSSVTRFNKSGPLESGSQLSFNNKQTSAVWMLNEIKSPTNQRIELEYTTIANPYEKKVNSYTQDFKNFWESEIYSDAFGTEYSEFIYEERSKYGTLLTISTSKEKQVYLKSIKFPSGYVNFTVSNRSDLSETRKLDNIKIYNLNSQIIKDITFNYSYTNDKPFNGVSTKRLRLDALSSPTEEGKYSFQYNKTILPSLNSFEQDYWGYPNGRSQNKYLVPNPTRVGKKLSDETKIGVTDNGNNMSANQEYTKSGILESISYPTGGSVSFKYELNEFNNYWVPDYNSLENQISRGQGLRVKQIEYKNSEGDRVKSEEYLYENGKSIIEQTVISFHKQQYLKFSLRRDVIETAYVYSVNTSGFHEYNPLASFGGVGYGKVTKYTHEGLNKQRIETIYNNTPNKKPKQVTKELNTGISISLPAFKDVDFPENGTVKTRYYFDNSNKLVKRVNYEYKNTTSPIKYGVRCGAYATLCLKYVHPARECETCITTGTVRPMWPVNIIGYYPIIDFQSLLVKDEITEYYYSPEGLKIGELTSIGNYSYNEYNLLSSQKREDSEGNLKEHYLGYPQKSTHNDLVQSNMLSTIVSNAIKDHNGKPLHEMKTIYSKNNSYNFIKPTSEINALTQDVVVTFDQYDAKGNIVQYTTLDGVSTVHIWSYSNQYPIAEIQNASYAQITAIITEANLKTISEKAIPSDADIQLINNLRNNVNLKGAMITTYTYKPLVGVTTMTDPSGITTYYDYDAFGRLKEIYTKENGVKKLLQMNDYHYQNQ